MRNPVPSSPQASGAGRRRSPTRWANIEAFSADLWGAAHVARGFILPQAFIDDVAQQPVGCPGQVRGLRRPAPAAPNTRVGFSSGDASGSPCISLIPSRPCRPAATVMVSFLWAVERRQWGDRGRSARRPARRARARKGESTRGYSRQNRAAADVTIRDPNQRRVVESVAGLVKRGRTAGSIRSRPCLPSFIARTHRVLHGRCEILLLRIAAHVSERGRLVWLYVQKREPPT